MTRVPITTCPWGPLLLGLMSKAPDSQHLEQLSPGPWERVICKNEIMQDFSLDLRIAQSKSWVPRSPRQYTLLVQYPPRRPANPGWRGKYVTAIGKWQRVQLLQNIEHRVYNCFKILNSEREEHKNGQIPKQNSLTSFPRGFSQPTQMICANQDVKINRHDCREVITHLLVKSRHGKTMRSTWTIHDISRKVLAVFIENKIIYYLCAVQFLKDCEYSNSKIHTLYLLVVFWKYRNYRCQGQAPAVCWATSWTPLQRIIVQHLNCTIVKRKWYSLGNKVEVISFHQ